MTLDELAAAAERMFREAGLADAVRSRRMTLAGVERAEWSREVGGATRYIQAHEVDVPGVPWGFALLGGSHGVGAGFDGRRGGDGEYALRAIRLWLVELAEWWEIRPFEEG